MDADDADEIMDRVREMVASQVEPLKLQLAQKARPALAMPIVKEFAVEMGAMIRDHIAKKMAPLEARISELEAERIPFKGVWQASGRFKRGDLVTQSGALWFATRDSTGERPGESGAFQLALKQGGAK